MHPFSGHQIYKTRCIKVQDAVVECVCFVLFILHKRPIVDFIIFVPPFTHSSGGLFLMPLLGAQLFFACDVLTALLISLMPCLLHRIDFKKATN